MIFKFGGSGDIKSDNRMRITFLKNILVIIVVNINLVMFETLVP